MGGGHADRRVIQCGGGEPRSAAPILPVDLHRCAVSQSRAAITTKPTLDALIDSAILDNAFRHREGARCHFGPGDEGTAQSSLAGTAMAVPGPSRRSRNLVTDRAAVAATLVGLILITHGFSYMLEFRTGFLEPTLIVDL